MASAHGVKRDVKRHAWSSQCEAYLCEFHTRYRLITHLAYRASACMGGLRSSFDPMTVEESVDLDLSDRDGHRDLLHHGHRITKAEKDYVQIPGPMCELAFGNDRFTIGDAAMVHIKPVWRRCDQTTSLPEFPDVVGCITGHFIACSKDCCLCSEVG